MNFSWRFGSREQALADSGEALRAVEALRDRQLEQAGRAGLFSRWLAPYYAASGHLLAAFERSSDPADLDRAFAITDSLRGRVLRELLGGPRASDPPPTRSAIEAGLSPEEALLSFQIAPRQDFFGFAGGSWLLVFTRGGTRVYQLPETVDRAHLETAVSALLGSDRSPGRQRSRARHGAPCTAPERGPRRSPAGSEPIGDRSRRRPAPAAVRRSPPRSSRDPPSRDRYRIRRPLRQPFWDLGGGNPSAPRGPRWQWRTLFCPRPSRRPPSNGATERAGSPAPAGKGATFCAARGQGACCASGPRREKPS